MTLFFIVTLNGLTLAALYFLAATGFSLIFGLMRTVNMAHGALLLLGGYVGFSVVEATGSWGLGVIAGGLAAALAGALVQFGILGWMQGDELRQTLASIAISIIMADLMLWHWGGITYQVTLPELLSGGQRLPLLGVGYASIRLALMAFALVIGVALWFLIQKTRFGAVIRAGVDDQAMLRALGFPIKRIFISVFALGGMLAGMAGVVAASALSIAPGTDLQFLLSSLVVVIVGGMGSVGGAALGALLVGLAEQYGLAYAPTYGAVFTFAIMVLVLAVRPQGLLGRAEK
ncbi:ABC transporter ATP-binding protein [Pseudooceanicola batsensis HTCC2597]|uniref:ABC transporter ATP-binding protein n=1 Tax=Pseudooceanicola batsensis (strain ATCC BAA-863 / DSM 15984 / KCTC 12145 / HTCC2597) TaxID=252305 RepID=A3U165_PSEBH|nr:branched-chain amino acid ABC transporter permease [Pseudooceanicola batsensis]EAQ02048.1 ABC transporter ATP-binding protein [Pseudooceanicola batsensis HTCC2597]